nr:Scr1 family TA system antitoxin-like transcriptional regulator [Streptomyces sp. Amel2xC10]
MQTEQAVKWQRAGVETMAAQCSHMAEVNRKPNVEIGIVPHGVHVPGIPMNIFVVYDDRLVTVELFSGEVVLRDPRDITQHLNLYELFWSHALTGEETRARTETGHQELSCGSRVRLCSRVLGHRASADAFRSPPP